ncbi:MAG TPA: YdeI/OmpD-associated family protein [Polyangiaceae bacterium]|jgi:hypothetical protein|nr:YdeI/OmpD-associated family protein [Polyangiaceae bacterium]
MAKTKARIEFRTALAKDPKDGEIAQIEVPEDVRAVFGKARPPVVVAIDSYEFRTTIMVYGGKSYVGVRRSHREAAKLAPGQRVRVVIELDEAPRTVPPPKELAAVLAKDKNARAAWEALSFTHQREHAEAIEDAKKPETRARRVEKTIAMLKKKR